MVIIVKASRFTPGLMMNGAPEHSVEKAAAGGLWAGFGDRMPPAARFPATYAPAGGDIVTYPIAALAPAAGRPGAVPR